MKTIAPMEAYLAPNVWIESAHPDVQRVARGFDSPEAAYRFVRDTVRHSYDIRAVDITATASEVLAAGHGICYAKAHLLAAILRAMGIPSGLAYQRLVLFDDPRDGYSLHAVNTIYLREAQRWVRVDARGNKPGVNAQYSTDKEMLAFPVRPELGEVDYPWNFDTPPAPIRNFYALQGNISELYARCLPGILEINDDTNS
ncbi:MAG: transglutaminase family protein [Akkermansiaceae bacterium]|nr:transglutaminase family protein [Armatimonadota bacterium]